jgi:2-methylcitrate dehydratase PrpD
VHEIVIPHAYGHPRAALTEAENRAKFLRCCGHGGLPPERAERLIALVERVEELPDIAALPALLAGRD